MFIKVEVHKVSSVKNLFANDVQNIDQYIVKIYMVNFNAPIFNRLKIMLKK